MGRAILGLLMWSMLAGGAWAQTLNIASSAPVTSIDPHYHTLSPNESLDSHIYDRLVDRDAAGHMIGGLAESWHLRDDRTWEFKLRSATFHDGTPFTAEDVVYTLKRVLDGEKQPGVVLDLQSSGNEYPRSSIRTPSCCARTRPTLFSRRICRRYSSFRTSWGPNPPPNISTAARMPSGPGLIVSCPIVRGIGSKWSGTMAIGVRNRIGSM